MPDDSLMRWIRGCLAVQTAAGIDMAKSAYASRDSIEIGSALGMGIALLLASVEHPEWAAGWNQRLPISEGRRAQLIDAVIEVLPIPPTEQPYPETPVVGDSV